jgi:hypothetical protein
MHPVIDWQEMRSELHHRPTADCTGTNVWSPEQWDGKAPLPQEAVTCWILKEPDENQQEIWDQDGKGVGRLTCMPGSGLAPTDWLDDMCQQAVAGTVRKVDWRHYKSPRMPGETLKEQTP